MESVSVTLILPSRLDFHVGVSVANAAAATGEAGVEPHQQQAVRSGQAGY